MQIYSHCVAIYYINATPYSQTRFVYPAPTYVLRLRSTVQDNPSTTCIALQQQLLFSVQDPSFFTGTRLTSHGPGLGYSTTCIVYTTTNIIRFNTDNISVTKTNKYYTYEISKQIPPQSNH